MKYLDGQEIMLGDQVRLGSDENGIVVASFETNEYSDNFPRAEWDYLKKGVLINFPTYGLIYYEEEDPDLQLVTRAK